MTSQAASEVTTCACTSESEVEQYENGYVHIDEKEMSFRLELHRDRVRSSDPTQGVDIAMEDYGLAADKSQTVRDMMWNTVSRVPHHVAMRYKEMGLWKDVTYKQYYDLCTSAARSFLVVRISMHIMLNTNRLIHP